MTWRCATHARAFACRGPSKKSARFGTDCGKTRIGCVLIFRPARPKKLWSRYMQLTEAEASFRALQSELSIRPLFHQREPCVKAHVMVAFLGYALWVTLKHLLKRSIVPQISGKDAIGLLSASKALSLLAT